MGNKKDKTNMAEVRDTASEVIVDFININSRQAVKREHEEYNLESNEAMINNTAGEVLQDFVVLDSADKKHDK